MQKRHNDHKLYFNEQAECMRRFVIPYIEQQVPITADMRVLEIGCGEAGNLKPFLDLGCNCIGIDIDKSRIDVAKTLYAEHSNADRMRLICSDIYDVKPEMVGRVNLIFLRDVIEHIPHQERFMHDLKRFMNDDTIVFFGFPVWCNPFGGHQQICKNKILSHLPWMHLLPRSLYKHILRLGGESDGMINELLNVKTTGMSIHRFEHILRVEQYRVLRHTHYLINPNYQIKFGLRPRVIPHVLQIPYLSDFYTTAMYYIISL